MPPPHEKMGMLRQLLEHSLPIQVYKLIVDLDGQQISKKGGRWMRKKISDFWLNVRINYAHREADRLLRRAYRVFQK